MPEIIDALASSGTPFSILTKGTLLRRDLPLLTEARSSVPVSISMSIAMPDERLRQTLEAGAPTFEARLQTVRAAADAGFAVTVFLMPIVPHLTDSVAVPAYRGLYPRASVYAPAGYRTWLAARVRPMLRRHRLAGGAEEEVETRPSRPGPVRMTKTPVADRLF